MVVVLYDFTNGWNVFYYVVRAVVKVIVIAISFFFFFDDGALIIIIIIITNCNLLSYSRGRRFAFTRSKGLNTNIIVIIYCTCISTNCDV